MMLKEEGRRNKEEEGGLYVWIGTPTQNEHLRKVGVLKTTVRINSIDRIRAGEARPTIVT
jgi:hypothetical protein